MSIKIYYFQDSVILSRIGKNWYPSNTSIKYVVGFSGNNWSFSIRHKFIETLFSLCVKLPHTRCVHCVRINFLRSKYVIYFIGEYELLFLPVAGFGYLLFLSVLRKGLKRQTAFYNFFKASRSIRICFLFSTLWDYSGI